MVGSPPQEKDRPRFGSACVLAGGRGRRMGGRDKLLLEYKGERLLARMARQLGSRFGDLVAVSSRPEAFEGLGYRVVPDVLSGAGPLSGLHAGLLAARSRWVYLVACDMPFLSAEWIDELERRISALEDVRVEGRGLGDIPGRGGIELPVAVAAAAGPYFEPFHAFYRVGFAAEIEASLSGISPQGGSSTGCFPPGEPAAREYRTPSIQAVARTRTVELVSGIERFGYGLELFFNMNTPQDIVAAEAAQPATAAEAVVDASGERRRLA